MDVSGAIVHFRSVLDKAGPENLQEQLDRVEREMPQLHAAFNLLCAVLFSEIERADRERQDSIIKLLPNILLRAAIDLPWGREFRQYLCEAINRWYAHVHFENWRRGILTEPGHMDC